jgi:hypothetical protein
MLHCPRVAFTFATAWLAYAAACSWIAKRRRSGLSLGANSQHLFGALALQPFPDIPERAVRLRRIVGQAQHTALQAQRGVPSNPVADRALTIPASISLTALLFDENTRAQISLMMVNM